MDEEDPKLNHLNCTGNEDSIEDCLSNIATAESCSSSVVLCQGIYMYTALCVQTVYIHIMLCCTDSFVLAYSIICLQREFECGRLAIYPQ